MTCAPHQSRVVDRQLFADGSFRRERERGVLQARVEAIVEQRDAPRVDHAVARDQRTAGGRIVDEADQLAGGQALPGLMEPADMAETYLFLASAVLSPYIVGQVIEVNGGQLMP